MLFNTEVPVFLEERAGSLSRYKMRAAGSSKHWYLSTKLHEIRSQKITIIFIFTGMRTLSVILKVFACIFACVNYRI